MTHKATKVVVITEKLIMERVTQRIEELGATGYTVVVAGGKGDRGVRSAMRASVVDGFRNVKIEAIVSDLTIAERIVDTVTDEFFNDYSGITYLEEVFIARPEKFKV